MLDRYLEVLDVEPTTRSTYEGYIRNHIGPVLGSLQLGRLESETIDAFYAQLRACRARCSGHRAIEHRTAREHACDDRCGPHQCKPMSAATVRQIDAILSGACRRAIRWKWISVNPVDSAEPPAAPAPNPQPPTTEQAARISVEAWKDPDWGMFVWLAMMTGARRGELCALTWDRLDFTTGVLQIRTSIAQDLGRTWEKDTKSHQQRRIGLDPPTLELLRLYLARCRERAAALDLVLADDTRVFSRDPDGETWPLPDSVSQRYERMCARLGLDFTIKELRLDRLTATGWLSTEQRQRLAADPATEQLGRFLRQIELAGRDENAELLQAIAERPLAGADSLASVLHKRLASRVGQVAPQGDTFASRLPATEDTSWRRYLEAVAEIADQRARELGVEVAEVQPQWAREGLSPVPKDAMGRLVWEERAGRVATYREMTAYEDKVNPLLRPGPPRTAPALSSSTAASIRISRPTRSRPRSGSRPAFTPRTPTGRSPRRPISPTTNGSDPRPYGRSRPSRPTPRRLP